MKHAQVLIIGGGTAGITVAAQLKQKDKNLQIAILEPSSKHYYQPAWTLVGAGAFDFKATERETAAYIPKGVTWIQDKATTIHPEKNTVVTDASGDLTYDYLVVAPGLVMAPELLPGLTEALGKDVVCSNYTDPEHSWEVIRKFKGGNAVFTQPTTPIKCGGAPQKIMYLAEEHFRKAGIRNKTNVVFATPGSVIFGVKDFARTLNKIILERDIILKTFYAPTKIDGPNREIYFRYAQPGDNNCVLTEDNRIGENIIGDSEIKLSFDMLHLAPPQQAPEFVRKSQVSAQDGPSKGWIDVNINTLQHARFANIFSLGDVAALPTAKTGAAIRKQAPVVVENLLQLIKTEKMGTASYEGYSSCPLVTGYSKMVLAEFKYDNVRDSDPLISKFVDTTKEQYSMWLLKKYGLPFMYWNMMLRGKA
ncbi:FAD-dependent pyridine nucleotide-disulfide oxidoreductase [Nitritalea halalkaliphila LW7]|uniref:FAD-dependent pyridine nucleotide-disulfide oxidoreductase n=1 Tax=Nitritalea halalkaliphila LW7 TaxID=1189621 RepID=I5C9G7_9BACT|nr:FAD/NAD(P)-binding oxidoreductase [Nitritalea halalkaliphila]EIM78469.1 FAD-dependent pyridine nucleotide-disulfide oxidoreductase [Nitritalea halalkaliphila LW7]